MRLAMTSDGLELVAVTQDVGQAHESLDAKYEGTELTVAFNPEYLLQGIEVLPGDEVHHRDGRLAQAGARPQPASTRSSSTCSCPCG